MSFESPSLRDALDAAVKSFVARNPKSKALHEEAVKTFPGGNTRTVLHTSPFPLCMKSGKDYQVISEDDDTCVTHTLALFAFANKLYPGTLI